MEALECISTRRSVRRFTSKPVDKATIESIVSCAQLSPSWKNTQPVRYTALLSSSALEASAQLLIAEGSSLGDWNAKIVSGAKALILISVVPGQSGHESDGTPSTAYGEGYSFFDTGCAAENLCLAAHAKGLGSVILGHFDFSGFRRLARLSGNEQPIVLVALGYPENAASHVPPARKPQDEVLRFI